MSAETRRLVAVWSGISGKNCKAGVWYTLQGGALVELGR